jgi:3-oxoadipate enol-lactonase
MQKRLYSPDHVRIHYDLSKDFKPSGALVFLHGMGGDLTAFNPIRELLHEEGYSSLAIDIRGQGRSGRPRRKNAYTVDVLADDVTYVLEKEKVKDAVLIGHCFGGIIAMSIAEKNPELFTNLILIDTNYHAPVWAICLTHISFFPELINFLIGLVPSWYIKSPVDYLRYKGKGDYWIPRIISDITHTSPKTYLLLSKTLLSLDMRPVLKKISIPTLIIEGELDTIYPPKVAENLHKLIPHSELVYIPQANHVLVISNVEAVCESISTYLHNKALKKQ